MESLMEDLTFRGLLFDLDGTLLDSFSCHYKAYEIMFARFGIEINEQRFLASYSPNWYQTYEAMGLPQAAWEQANRFWLEEASKQQPDLFPGVKERLHKMAERCALGLVTSGSRNRVLEDIERSEISGVFQTVITGDDVQEPKPSPEGIELALERLVMAREEVIYIGDAIADYEMARASGVRFKGVASAFRQRAPDSEPWADSITSLLDRMLELAW